jgi:hypothetical protein
MFDINTTVKNVDMNSQLHGKICVRENENDIYRFK